MAMTAAITLSSATANAGQKVTATVTVTNSSSTTVTVLSIEPNCIASGGTSGAGQSVDVLLGRCNAGGPGVTSTVAGSSGTTAFTFDVVPNTPISGTYASNPFPSGITPLPALASPTSQVFVIGAQVNSSDGSSVVASTSNLTVAGLTR